MQIEVDPGRVVATSWRVEDMPELVADVRHLLGDVLAGVPDWAEPAAATDVSIFCGEVLRAAREAADAADDLALALRRAAAAYVRVDQVREAAQ